MQEETDCFLTSRKTLSLSGGYQSNEFTHLHKEHRLARRTLTFYSCVASILLFSPIIYLLKHARYRPEKAINSLNIRHRFIYKVFNLLHYVPRNPELCASVYMQSLCRRLVLRIKQFRYVVCVINALKHPQQLSAEGQLLNAANITVCLFGGRHAALVHSLLSPINPRCFPDIVSLFCPPPPFISLYSLNG